MNPRIILALLLFAGSGLLLWFVFLVPEPASPPPPADVTASLYQPRDWQQGEDNELNISLYTFRDRNRNGDHDSGDLPMANVGVKLTPPGDAKADLFATSNINGYANYKMARNNPAHPVNQPGVYRFEVIPPPGWKVTSGNPVQEINFIELNGSVTGLVAEKPPHWVGLAPDLSIRISPVPSGSSSEAIHLSLESDQGVHLDGMVSSDDTVNFAVTPGVWTVTGQSIAGKPLFKQQVTVTDLPVLLTPEIADSTLSPLPRQLVEDFEWLDRSVIDKLPNGHLGLNWDYLLAVENQYYTGPGYVNGLTSGRAVAYNSSGHPVTISAKTGEKFDFIGGNFSVAWPKAHGESLLATAWRDKKVIASVTIPLSYLGPIRWEPNFLQIDKLTLTSEHYWQFVADDLAFRTLHAPQ